MAVDAQRAQPIIQLATVNASTYAPGDALPANKEAVALHRESAAKPDPDDTEQSAAEGCSMTAQLLLN